MRKRLFGLFCLLAFVPGTLYSYPEFEIFIERSSQRHVDCAFCHEHAEGPEGLKPGQMGNLTPEQMELLGKARAAFDPGSEIDNPLLNRFGDHLVAVLGKREILLLRNQPGQLAERLSDESDLDGDGISDPEEYLAGTHPLDPRDGNPWQLLRINLAGRSFEILMILMVTALGLYGLNHLLVWFRLELEQSREETAELQKSQND